MSRDVPELLRQTADHPTRELDALAIVTSARRRRRLTRVAGTLGAVGVIAIASFLALPLGSGSDQEFEIADRPDPDGGSETSGRDDDPTDLKVDGAQLSFDPSHAHVFATGTTNEGVR